MKRTRSEILKRRLCGADGPGMDNPWFLPDFLIHRSQETELSTYIPDPGSENGGKGPHRDEELLLESKPRHAPFVSVLQDRRRKVFVCMETGLALSIPVPEDSALDFSQVRSHITSMEITALSSRAARPDCRSPNSGRDFLSASR